MCVVCFEAGLYSPAYLDVSYKLKYNYIENIKWKTCYLLMHRNNVCFRGTFRGVSIWFLAYFLKHSRRQHYSISTGSRHAYNCCFLQKVDAAELLRLYLNYDLLEEAVDLVSEYVDAVLGKGHQYFGIEVDAYECFHLIVYYRTK